MPDTQAKPSTAEQNKQNKNNPASKTGEDPDKNDSRSDSEQEDSAIDDRDDSAPVELKAEFVECLHSKDWVNALKLCKMILMYEPNNPTAKEYITVLQERLLLDDEVSSDSSDDETSSGDESDENDVSSNGDGESASASDSDNVETDVVISIKK